MMARAGMGEGLGRACGMGWIDGITDRLAGLGDISSSAMFGGHGLYWRGVIFGICHRDRLYLKVDERSKGDYLAKGMGPFRPNERQTLRSSTRSSDILDDPGRCSPGPGRRSGRGSRHRAHDKLRRRTSSCLMPLVDPFE